MQEICILAVTRTDPYKHYVKIDVHQASSLRLTEEYYFRPDRVLL